MRDDQEVYVEARSPRHRWPLRFRLAAEDVRDVEIPAAGRVDLTKTIFCPYCRESHEYTGSIDEALASRALARGDGADGPASDVGAAGPELALDIRRGPESFRTEELVDRSPIWRETEIDFEPARRANERQLTADHAIRLYRQAAKSALDGEGAEIDKALEQLAEAAEVFDGLGRTRDAAFARAYRVRARLRRRETPSREWLEEIDATLAALDPSDVHMERWLRSVRREIEHPVREGAV